MVNGMQRESNAIHEGVHDARPDAVCVFYLHSPYTTALGKLYDMFGMYYFLALLLGMLEEEVFGMYHQTHCRFYNDFAYDPIYKGAATSCKEGERLAKLIRNKSALFMGNHGALFTGPTAANAFDTAYFMERACMMQVLFLLTFQMGRERDRGRGRKGMK